MRTEKIVLFRQSNVTYSEYLTIKLTGRNRLAIVGGTDDDLDVIRNCLQSRWPYPLSRDYKVLSGVSSLIQTWKDMMHRAWLRDWPQVAWLLQAWPV